ncbi:S-layer protein [Methanococcoides sp. SA1]|nr:S-layer protein [Methanococcoides sp. SA1]
MNKHFKFMLISLLILGMSCGVAMADNVTAPAGVTDLNETSVTDTQIEWVWTDPTDLDFDHVEIWMGGSLITNVSKDDQSYTNSSLSSGTPYTIDTYTVDTFGNRNSTAVSDDATTTSNPPAGVTGLNESSVTDTQIEWVWTDPIDSDLDHVEIWLNSSFIENVSAGIESYTNSSLSPGTTYTITTYTVDDSDNRNSTPISDDATTTAPDGVPPASVTNLQHTVGDHWILWTWTDPSDSDFDHVNVSFDGSTSTVDKGDQEYNATGLNPLTDYTINTYTVDNSGNQNATAVFDSGTTTADTTAPGPITSLSSDIGSTWIEWSWTNPSDSDFNHTEVTINDGSAVILGNTTSSYNATGLTADSDYTILIKTVDLSGNKDSGVSDPRHTVILTYSSGDRIWDVNAKQSLDYTWNALSYSGFFYDLESGLGSETMTIHLDDDDDRNIGDGDLEYETSPVETDFKYGAWGSYEVIGFMAEKYFAGYISNTSSDVSSDSISLMSKGHLAKVLIDSDDKQSVYGGAGLVLEDGYVLNIVELDLNGDRVFVSLSKDGDEVDELVVSSGNPYVYEKDLGDVDDVPIIAVNFAEIFSGTETSAVFIEGIFQISDEYEDINRGDEYGAMEVKTISSDKIRMENQDTISLDKGDIADIMGKLKFIVADDNDLRFAPFVDMSEPGTYELRGTIAENGGLTWTTLNFEGFYYNIDEGIGTETLNLTLDGRTIDDDDLVYTTSPSDVSFEHSDWGEYKVIGFMAEKFFAGYPDNEFTNDVSMISKGQLSKVLIDDDDKRSVFGGSSIILEEGYALDIVEVDQNGERVFVSLSKDGDEVDEFIVSSDDTYVYEKDLGDVDDVPIIAVYFKEIFSGRESTAVFVEGIFQISDEYDEINTGDNYGEMEVKSISSTKIEMRNEDSISLSKGDEIEIMGEIKFKVADSNTVRYYPFVEISTEPADSLDVEVDPEIVSEGDKITVTVTSRGSLVNGVTVKSGNIVLGTTDDEGEVDYTFHDNGKYTITAEKDGYTNGEAVLEVISPDDESRKMSIEVLPEVIYEGNLVTFTVVKSIGGDPLEDVDVVIDGKSIGSTDSDGVVTDVLREIGVHKITAKKEGFLGAELNLEVNELEAKFEFSNLVVTPLEVKTGKNVKVKLDAVNNGKAAGSYTVELLVNDNTTAAQEISLGVGESAPVEFVYTAGEPGTYLVKVGGMTATVEVVKGTSTVTYLVGGAAIAVLGGAVYLFTAGGWTVSTAGAKAGEAAAVLSEKLSSLLSRGK